MVGTFVGWRRARFRFSVLAAGLTGVVVIAAGWSLNHRLSLALYPEGPRSLAATARTRLTTVLGVIHVLEHAVGGAAARIPEITGFPGVSGCSGVQESGLLSEPAWRR